MKEVNIEGAVIEFIKREARCIKENERLYYTLKSQQYVTNKGQVQLQKDVVYFATIKLAEQGQTSISLYSRMSILYSRKAIGVPQPVCQKEYLIKDIPELLKYLYPVKIGVCKLCGGLVAEDDSAQICASCSFDLP